MDHELSPHRSRSRVSASLEQRIVRTAIEVNHAIARAEDYRQHLASQVHRLFAADAGAGLTTWRPHSAPEVEVTIVVAGAPVLSEEQKLRAAAVAGTHPGMLAMARAGTTAPVRISDHTDVSRFWDTEIYRWMHGHAEGRYPASALLLDTFELQVFIGMHRHDRDFTDADMARLAALQRPLAAAMSFRAALDETVRLLQHSSRMVPSERTGDPACRRRSLDAAVRLCGDYEPTRREGEVLALAAQGWTNSQVGRRLGITERTVRKHLTNVYDKAGVRGRAAAAAWWQRRND